MSVEPDPVGGSPPEFEERNLRVVLEVERGGPCVLDSLADDIIGVDVRLDNRSCNLDVRMEQGSGADGSCTKHVSRELCAHCPGKVFSEYGCLPRYLQVDDGGFIMETYVSDTETVAEIVEDVREICERVSVRSIVSTNRSEFREICSIDISMLTAKQREALGVAQEAGYYDPERDAALDELANELDITPSALSQRLRRAESNVLRQLTCGCLPKSE